MSGPPTSLSLLKEDRTSRLGVSFRSRPDEGGLRREEPHIYRHTRDTGVLQQGNTYRHRVGGYYYWGRPTYSRAEDRNNIELM